MLFGVFDHQRAGFSTRNLDEQGGGPFDGTGLTGRIDAALEPKRCVGVHPVCTRAARHEVGRPIRRFKKHVRCILRHCSAQTAHDSGYTNRAAVVRNDHRVSFQRHFFTVEQHNPLTALRQSWSDRTLQQLRIVCV